MSKTAVITGITGQDGSYLTELLLDKGYAVHGVVRRASLTERPRLEHLTLDPALYGSRLFLHYADLEDVTTIRRLLSKITPDEIYHLAGQSHVGLSFDIPESTCDFTAMGTLRLLEIVRDLAKPARFLNVGSSEIFGRPEVTPQNERTPFAPITPYGVAKAFAVAMVRVYRDSFGVFGVNAICYNHESPRRGPSFVTRKITRAVAAIHHGQPQTLPLGNLDARRDWGFAGDYVEGMWRMLQQDQPSDYVLATGRLTSVREFLGMAFGVIGKRWEDYVTVDPKFLRRADPQVLSGDATSARETLGWTPSVSVEQLVGMMVRADIEAMAPK
jgi:GDPmannose 4,6-dehydratase